MKLIKILSVAAALAIFAGVCGCGGADGGGYDESKHFTVYIKDTSDPPDADNTLLKKIKDELGYTFDFDYLVGNHLRKRRHFVYRAEDSAF